MKRGSMEGTGAQKLESLFLSFSSCADDVSHC